MDFEVTDLAGPAVIVIGSFVVSNLVFIKTREKDRRLRVIQNTESVLMNFSKAYLDLTSSVKDLKSKNYGINGLKNSIVETGIRLNTWALFYVEGMIDAQIIQKSNLHKTIVDFMDAFIEAMENEIEKGNTEVSFSLNSGKNVNAAHVPYMHDTLTVMESMWDQWQYLVEIGHYAENGEPLPDQATLEASRSFRKNKAMILAQMEIVEAGIPNNECGDPIPTILLGLELVNDWAKKYLNNEINRRILDKGGFFSIIKNVAKKAESSEHQALREKWDSLKGLRKVHSIYFDSNIVIRFFKKVYY